MTKKTEGTDGAPSVKKTNLYAIFGTDTKKEEEGAWVTINDLWGLKIKVRRLRSDASVKAYEQIVKEKFGEGALRKSSDFSSEQSMAILKEQLARAVLIDWENLRDADTGENIPYSIDAARELLEIRDFREFVWQAAHERDTFKSKSDEEAEGN